MDAILIYGASVLLLVAGSFLVAFNYYRYRFAGDATGLILLVYASLFVTTVALTIAMATTQTVISTAGL